MPAKAARDLLIAVLVALFVSAIVPLAAYPFINPGSWLNPYRNRTARRIVYAGAAAGIILLFIFARQ